MRRNSMLRKALICGVALLSLSSSCFASDIPVNNDSAPIVSKNTLEAKTPQDKLFWQGADAILNKDYPLVIQCFTEYLEKYGENIGAYRNRALAYEKVGKYDLAINDYSAAIKLSPKYDLFIDRGDAYYAKYKFKDAASDYERALKDIPKEKKDIIYELYINLGYCHYYYYKYDKSEECFKKVLNYSDSKDGLKSAASLGLGRLYESQRKDYNTVLSEYNAAIKYCPDWASPYYYKFDLELAANNKADALQDINKAIEYDGNNSMYYYCRADLFKELCQYNLAVDDYTKAMELPGCQKDVYKHRADIFYWHLMDNVKAMADYVKFIELTNDKPFGILKDARAESYTQIGVILLGEQKYEQAIDSYTNAIEIYDKDTALMLELQGFYEELSDCYHNRAYSYACLHKYDKAISDYNNAIKFNPNECRNYIFRGDAYKAIGDKSNAFADYYKAMQLTDDKNAIESIKEKMKM